MLVLGQAPSKNFIQKYYTDSDYVNYVDFEIFSSWLIEVSEFSLPEPTEYPPPNLH